MKKLFSILIMSIALAGCNLGVAPTSTGPEPTETPINGDIPAASLSSPRVLAWNPNSETLGWAQAGGMIPLKTGLSERSIVLQCGEPTTGAGESMIIYVGGDTAQPVLYPIGGGEPTLLGETIGMTCALQKRIHYSPDGKRLGLIQYVSSVRNANFAVGMLRVLQMPDNTAVFSANDVTSFQLYDDGVLVLQIYSGGDGRGRSAVLRWWDGSNERILEQNILSLDGCQFVAGSTIRVGETVYTLFGERCTNQGSIWRLMKTDFAGGNSANVESEATGGRYFVTAASNDLWSLPATEEVLIAYPNGLAADVVNLERVSVKTGAAQTVMNGVVVDQYQPSAPRRFLFSPDHSKLAFVTRDGNGGEALYIYDLSQPAEPPQQVAGGNRSDRIGAVAWAGDGSRLFYILSGDLNSLSSFSMMGESKVIARGQFQMLVASANGKLVATSEQVRLSASDVRNNLVVINTESQEKTVLIEGAKGDSALTPLVVR
ncbi:MAG: hypothetical protein KF726_19945 [Anaerolineae bacterium]|nr:hypothetical protein [Anaerolineae bacterium]